MMSTTNIEKIFTKSIKPAIGASEEFMISQASFVYELPKSVTMKDPREAGQWATVSSQLTISDRVIVQVQCFHSLSARLVDEGLAVMIIRLQDLLRTIHTDSYDEDAIFQLFTTQSIKLFTTQQRI